MKMLKWVAAAGLLAGGLAAQASAAVVPVVVDSFAQPWFNSVNPTFSFGIQDGNAPTIVSSLDGLDFSAGNTLTVQYDSGLTSPYGATLPYADANGDITYDASANSGSSGFGFPSQYVSATSYPVYLNSLIGTFTDSTGVIVGTPFFLGNGPTDIVIPAGATQLQLGVNDDIYSDNSGSLNINVAGVVPEPATASLILIPLAAGMLRRRSR